MGDESIKINNEKEFNELKNDNRFWCEFIEGEHISWDLIIRNGKCLFNLCWKGIKSKSFGVFDYWDFVGSKKIVDNIKKVISLLKGYTGTLNVETIGNKVIECHLRSGDIDMVSKSALYPYIINCVSNDDKLLIKYINNVKYEKEIYLIAVWQYNKKNMNYVFKKLSKYENMIVKNDDIDIYYFDRPNMASPTSSKRWFLLRTTKFKEIYCLKKKIEKYIEKII